MKLLKRKRLAGFSFLLLLLGCTSAAPTHQFQQQQAALQQQPVQTANLEGAWRTSDPAGNEVVMLVQDGFVTIAMYNQSSKKFLGTYGGTYTASDGAFTVNYEFHTTDSTKVGSSASSTYQQQNNSWQMTNLDNPSNKLESWARLDEKSSTSPLAGTWRITGRERDGQMSIMRPGPRKTLKVLSGTRFQWIAFNSETGEFSGTGGGTYTAQDGKYTEHIEFFSRDSSRVGMQLSFNYEVKDGKWHHTGQSSTGSKVNEIWERITAQ